MTNLQAWLQEFENKKVLIWGWGMEGKSSYRFIRKLLPEQVLTIVNQRGNDNQKEQVLSATTNTVFLYEDEVEFNAYDLIIKSPGIVVPEGIDKTKISGQAPLFLKHYRNQVIGVTGTKGKSTTTSLIASVLSEKYKTHLVGNIGKACFDVIEELEKDDLVAFEISCHQLEYAKDSPHIAVYINLFDEHLDHYGTFENYAKSKDQIFLHQKEDDILIIGKDIAYRSNRKNQFLIGKDIDAKENKLIISGHALLVEDGPLVGHHNEQNMAVAYMIGTLYGIGDEQFLHAIHQFKPLHHRLENIGEKDGVIYVDDSISTIGESCIQAIDAYPNTKTVLIGGNDRGIHYDTLETFLSSRSDLNLIFMYASGKRILEEMKEKKLNVSHICYEEDLEKAVKKAKEITPKNHVCLLSPAASSYDHFKNFEERGDVFRKLVMDD